MLLTTHSSVLLVIRAVACGIAVVAPGARRCRSRWLGVASSHQSAKADLSPVTSIARCCLIVSGLIHVDTGSMATTEPALDLTILDAKLFQDSDDVCANYSQRF